LLDFGCWHIASIRGNAALRLLSESRADDGAPEFGAKRKAPVAGFEQVDP
jgi:hypothetical protein